MRGPGGLRLPADCHWVRRAMWPVCWLGLHRRCPDAAARATLANWAAAFGIQRRQWAARDAAVETMCMNARAGRTWTAETAAELTLRRLERERTARGLAAGFWVPNQQPERGGNEWRPSARGLLLPCRFGCASIRDNVQHFFECQRRPLLQGIRVGLAAVLGRLGLSGAPRVALSHHPTVVREVVQGYIPAMWSEIIPDLSAPAKRRYIELGLTLVLRKFKAMRLSCPAERQGLKMVDALREVDVVHALVWQAAPEGTNIIAPGPWPWVHKEGGAGRGGLALRKVPDPDSPLAGPVLMWGERGWEREHKWIDQVLWLHLEDDRGRDLGWAPAGPPPRIRSLGMRGSAAEDPAAMRWDRPVARSGPWVCCDVNDAVRQKLGAASPATLRARHDWRARRVRDGVDWIAADASDGRSKGANKNC